MPISLSPLNWQLKIASNSRSNFSSLTRRSNWYNVCAQSPSLSQPAFPHVPPSAPLVSGQQASSMMVGLSRVILILLAKSFCHQPALSYIILFYNLELSNTALGLEICSAEILVQDLTCTVHQKHTTGIKSTPLLEWPSQRNLRHLLYCRLLGSVG